MKYNLLIGALMMLSACTKLDGYLDKAESGGMTEEQVFGNYVQTQSFLADIYATGIGKGDWLPAYSFTYGAAADEGKCPYNFATGPTTFNINTLSPTNNPVDIWSVEYQYIRKVNMFLQHIDLVPISDDPNQQDGKMRMKGEAYFLRAWFYSELYKRYGGVPLVDHVLNIDDNLNIPRNTDDETVSFIVKDCETAAGLLPATYTIDNLGRATSGAALMLKGRTLLFAASLLHNPSNDKEKWKTAAAACKAVLDLKTYSLDPNYKAMLHTRTPTEIIFQSTVNQVWQITADDWVRETQPPGQGGGWANLQPTQNLVDAYEMSNGQLITDATSGYDAANPYLNRDPRFYATVIYNGCKWAGSTIYTYVGAGVDGLNNKSGATQTGYYAGGKMLDENSTLISSYKPGSHFWVFMRFGEALLNYAEAQNEAVGADQSVYDAVNAIRTRSSVNMPPLPAALSQDQMRQRIRHERQVELALEGNRFWDVRRWRTGVLDFTDAMGMKVTKTTTGTYQYEKIVVESRSYKPAFDLFPIPQSEMERNKTLKQNEGYFN
jgi:hypothetical protein